jgi:hypothetical protein
MNWPDHIVLLYITEKTQLQLYGIELVCYLLEIYVKGLISNASHYTSAVLIVSRSITCFLFGD